MQDIKFSDIEYKRVNIDELAEELEKLIESFNSAKSFDEADEVFLEFEKRASLSESLLTVARIRNDINTVDEFYEQEVAYYDAKIPELMGSLQKWNLALLKSHFRKDFAEKYNSIMFLNKEIQIKSFSPAIIEEMKQENALSAEYDKLIAGAKVEFEGKTYTLSQMTPFTQSADDERRRAAWKAYDTWFLGQREALDRIYEQMVKLRDTMGKKLGHPNYIQLGYYRMMRNSYTKEDVERFREAVRNYIVPIATEIKKAQAERISASYPLSYSDNALFFRSGNPKPNPSEPEEILKRGREFYHELSDETAKFIDALLDREFLDVLSRENKSSGGYCTYLDEYKSPFIFANFNGTSHDIEVITHEAGHAFASYLGRDIIPSECRWPTLEACEVHSMSMEFFSWPWAERFFSEDAKKFKYNHLAGSITFIPYGTLVDHFQHSVYEKPEMTPAERNTEWKRLAAIYMPWIRDDEELEFFSEGRFWQKQIHIYSRPFYYIDYCLAQTVALQFWALIQEDKDKAWEKYMAYSKKGGSMGFTELLAQAGLSSPFEPGTLKSVAEKAAEYLKNFDLSEIK